MSKIPTGTVTFLFTDIEGSTKLAQRFHESHHSILQQHNSILKKAIESNKGFIFKTIGDSFCASFENVIDAIYAAYAAQKNLTSKNCGQIKIKVRMGIHTGEAEYVNGDYMGYITLSRVQRIMSVAAGGQMLLSRETFDEAKTILSGIFSFRDLGERKLKDIILPEHIYQLIADGLPSDFPPLKTLDARPNNLPSQLTSFIGREKEINEIKKLLSNTKLLTLVGPGGTGKTRLSLQVGADLIDDFANGVWFIELAPLADPGLLPQAISKTFGIKEEPKKSLEDTLSEYFKDKELLIILDNCEHLIQECSKLTEKLLTDCPKLKIIATSREGLKCSGEQIYRVPSLTLPDPKKRIPLDKLFTQYESVRLFIDRALAVNPDFQINNSNAPALTEICCRLDGIPLAIELAAARIKILSVEKIYERLNDRFKLLTEGKRTALPRQQTLKAMIDWSYNLLTKTEKVLYRRLSVFNGGWTLEAAESVCVNRLLKHEKVLDTLSQLVNKSLVVYDRQLERYRMLETIKQYGEELFGKEEKKKIKQNHFKYFFQLAEKVNPELYGPLQKKWLERMEIENSNFQSALLFSLGEVQNEEGIRLAILLGKYWKIRGFVTEGKRWLKELLQTKERISLAMRAQAIKLAGSLEWLSGNLGQSQNLHEESLSIYRQLEDKKGIASSLGNLGLIEFQQGEYENARVLTEESLRLHRELADEYNTAASLLNLGCIFMLPGEYEFAKSAFDESLQIFREHEDLHGIALCLCNLGTLSHYLGEYSKAQILIEESIALNRELGNKHDLALSLNSLGYVASDLGEFERSLNLHKESLKLRLGIGNKSGMVTSIIGISDILHLENMKDTAILLGAVKTALNSLEGIIVPQIISVYQRTVSILKEKLGNENFSKYSEEGNTLTIEQAAHIALGV